VHQVGFPYTDPCPFYRVPANLEGIKFVSEIYWGVRLNTGLYKIYVSF
jgi:hypothetical protein